MKAMKKGAIAKIRKGGILIHPSPKSREKLLVIAKKEKRTLKLQVELMLENALYEYTE